MLKFTSTDFIPLQDGVALFFVQSPFTCARNQTEIKAQLGEQVIIDGRICEVKHVEFFLSDFLLRKGEKIKIAAIPMQTKSSMTKRALSRMLK